MKTYIKEKLLQGALTLRRYLIRTALAVAALAVLGFVALPYLVPKWEREAQARQVERKAEYREELLDKAVFADYVAPEGTKSECLGRHVFNVTQGFTWGVGRVGFDSLFDRPGVSRHLEDPARKGWMLYGGVALSIVVPRADGEYHLDKGFGSYLDYVQHAMFLDQKNAIRHFEKEIESQYRQNKTTQYYLDHPEESPDDGPTPERRRQSLKERIEKIAEFEKTIERIKVNYEPIDLGLPDAKAFDASGRLYAWFKRGDYIVQFMSAPADALGWDFGGFENRKAHFLDVVKRYRSRKLHEIPTEPGVCLPYGFIPDDGAGIAELTMPFRYADAPNVLYTLSFKTYRPSETGPQSEASLVNATARGLAGYAATAAALKDADAEVIERFGPRGASMGKLPGNQGGVAVRFNTPGEPAFENYSVYTGFDGFVGSLALPAMAFEMRSFPKGLAPDELTTQPPPFDQSMKRYEAILSSLRLRPTTPLLPEVAKHLKH